MICGCGCEAETKPNRRFLHGHRLRLKENHFTGSVKGKRPDVRERNIKLNPVKKWRFINGIGTYKRARKDFYERCQKSSTETRLMVHHRDENRQNNTEKNKESRNALLYLP
jgi:hypothetical protein